MAADRFLYNGIYRRDSNETLDMVVKDSNVTDLEAVFFKALANRERMIASRALDRMISLGKTIDVAFYLEVHKISPGIAEDVAKKLENSTGKKIGELVAKYLEEQKQNQLRK